MAIYVELIKSDVIESDFVNYSYEFSILYEKFKNKAGKLRGRSKLVNGKIRINKKTGEVQVIELAEGDNGMYAQRAAAALRRDWRRGEYPDKTCWAS